MYLRKTNEHYDCLLPRITCAKNSCVKNSSVDLNVFHEALHVESVCPTYSNGKLKLYFRNVCGLNQEYLHDDIEGSVLKQQDIIMFAESHCDPKDELSLDGFLPLNYARRYRHVNAKKGSGGLFIFIRESI